MVAGTNSMEKGAFSQVVDRPTGLDSTRDPAPNVKTGKRTEHGFYIASLDGIRAVSMCMVFFSHLNLWRIFPGMFGVSIFFLLSGFLITTLMIREFTVGGRISIKEFYIRRALRIFPPMYIVLFFGALLVLCGIMPAKLNPIVFMAQCIHLSNYLEIRSGMNGMVPGFGVYWSLAVEEHFYLVFPLVFALGYGRLGARRLAFCLFNVAVAVFAWRIILVFVLHTQNVYRTGLATDTRIDSILWGCILALWRNPALNPAAARSLASGKICAGALIILLAALIYHNPDYRETFRYTLESLCLIPLFCAAILRTEWLPVRFLNTRFMQWLGRISFTFYLCHAMFFLLFTLRFPEWPKVAIILATLASSLALSEAMRLAVEIPLARVRKKYHSA
jgi:peptidoglycan/LPS O-acetylase OafA/YrhL